MVLRRGREFPQSAGRSSLVKQPVKGYGPNGTKACNWLFYTVLLTLRNAITVFKLLIFSDAAALSQALFALNTFKFQSDGANYNLREFLRKLKT